MHQLGQVFPLVVTVNEHRHKKGPHHRNRGGFCGGKNTTQNATQNDAHGHQAPHCIGTNFERLFHRDYAAFGVVFLARHIEAINCQTQPQQQSGEDTRHEQGGYRHRTASCHRIDHRIVARWNQNSLHRAAHSDSRGKWPWITILLHFGNEDRANGCRIGHRRTGNCPKKSGRQNIDQRQAATHETDQHTSKRDKTPGHAAFGHDCTCQYKAGNGQQGKFVDATGHLDHDCIQRQVNPHRPDQGGEAQGICHGHAHQHQQNKTAN